MMSTGEDSTASMQDYSEPSQSRSSLLDTSDMMDRLCRMPIKQLPLLRTMWRPFNRINTVEVEDRPVPAVPNRNGYKWNMTEDEYDLWVFLDEGTTELLLQKCPEKAEVVRRLRSEACKGKAINLPSTSIAAGPSTASPASFDLEAGGHSCGADNRPQSRQTLPVLGDGHQASNPLADPANRHVNFAPPKQIGQYAAASWDDLEANETFSRAEINGSPTHQTLPVYSGGHQVPKQQADPANRFVNSAPHNQAVRYTTTSVALSRSENGTPPHQTLPVHGGGTQVHNQQADPPNRSVDSPPPSRTGRYELENIFMVVSQIISSAVAVSAKNKNLHNAEILWYILVGCIFVGIISWLYGSWLFGRDRQGKASRFLLIIAYIATAFALLAVVGLHLPDELMLWFTLGACMISLPAIIGYDMN